MRCPKCEKETVQERSTVVYCSYPPQWEQREWCACGYRGDFYRVYAKTAESQLLDEWNYKNAGER